MFEIIKREGADSYLGHSMSFQRISVKMSYSPSRQFESLGAQIKLVRVTIDGVLFSLAPFSFRLWNFRDV